MLTEAQTNPNLAGNALGYPKRSNLDDAFKDDEFSDAIGEMFVFSILAERGIIERDFIYNFSNEQFSFIIDKLADLAQGWRKRFKGRGRQTTKLPNGMEETLREMKEQVYTLYGVMKDQVGILADYRGADKNRDTLIEKWKEAVLNCYDQNPKQFCHLDRDLIEDTYPYTGMKPSRDFPSRILIQIAKRKKWGKLAGSLLLKH